MNSTDVGRPLTDEELSALRIMLEKERRMVWFWSTMRVWAGWMVAIISLYVTAKTISIDLISRLMK